MDYNKKKEAVFDDEASKAQLAKAFAKQPEEEQKEVTLSDDFNLPSTSQFQRKVQTTYTIRPDVKKGIDKLAAEQGFRSASAFVDLILEQVLKQK
ncbi:hypothetical protein LNP18_02815 [Leuconostoc citreum]|uniref:hypothetical protein n=1 Tax=Leuconostoc citreum TaxID=33964 RepID=UPI00200B1B78|nr:hypothetical protein [Leuconostoc citreum]MCK8605029.1 hypothetical protein [Leuconostoc citreum]